MVRIGRSETLGRNIRRDDWADIGVPTWTLAMDSIREGRTGDALQFVDHARVEGERIHESFLLWLGQFVDYVADHLGEEEVERVWRALLGKGTQMDKTHMPLHVRSIEEAVQIDTQFQRGHLCGLTGLGDLSVVEEDERYVVTVNPCGSGGRLRNMGLLGITKKPYPWSWGMAGVSYYCVHCCLQWEIMPLEQVGYPWRVHENVDRPGEPCVHFFYKKPELIPEKYFARLGVTRGSHRRE